MGIIFMKIVYYIGKNKQILVQIVEHQVHFSETLGQRGQRGQRGQKIEVKEVKKF